MPFCADNMQPTRAYNLFMPPFPILILLSSRSGIASLNRKEGGPISTQDNINSSPGHVCGNRNCPRFPRLGNNLSLPLVVFSIQDIVWNSFSFQKLGNYLVLLDRGSPNQNRPACLSHLINFPHNSRVLCPSCFINNISKIPSYHRPVSGHRNDI